MAKEPGNESEILLSEDVLVSMPELPATLRVHTAQQFKAMGDTTRSRILDLIKFEPLTAKQLGARLDIPPGTIGHHLQVLEAAGLAQIVARRLVHGIVAKYYTRTARLFQYDFPSETSAGIEKTLQFLTEAREQLADALLTGGDDTACKTAFPHARLSPERAAEFHQRLFDLVYEFATEPPDPAGQVYGLCTAFFLAPPYLQNTGASSPTTDETEQ